MSLKDVTPNGSESMFNRLKRSSFKIRYLYFVLVILAGLYYYMALPAFHYASMDFWLFIGLIALAVIGIESLVEMQENWQKIRNKNKFQTMNLSFSQLKKFRLLAYLAGILAIVAIVSNLVFSPFFMAKRYANLLQPQVVNFQEDFPQVDLNQVPLVDRDTAIRLGNRRLGSLTDLVSQFEVSEEYTQININAKPYRVTPLKYAGFFKWVNNFRKGIPHYLQVDNVTGEVQVQTPSKPIKYSYADHFNRYILRHLRFKYPFKMFERPSFEVDDQGTPYYIATTYGRNFFLREPEPRGLIIVNAMTGEDHYYKIDQVPDWVDRVYGADLVMHQLELNGKYHKGFWNNLFAKEGVTRPSEGYNYLPMQDDLYLYTGVTSVSADESNIGFVLVNLRTKEAKMYPLSAAEELSAMESAEGSVQEKGYKATFPLLINLQGRPMYILTLKDSSGLIKSYALVDVQNYQNVYVANSMKQLISQYAQDHTIDVKAANLADLKEIKADLDQIQAVVKEGQTIYYFMVDGQVYQADVSLNPYLPFVESGDPVRFQVDGQGQVQSMDLSERFGKKASPQVVEEASKEVSPSSEDPLVE
ncbi:hypothetical protein [Facklamia hominis]|uniref:CvpA family protein n=1 Tax=Facklamia hominis TaxID=178214 RepID=A0AAJ1Q6G8_9LACT|nr:hypothetical protein [Facklamia hominis]MDK7187436.1 hypothetical protein [Facklamia hominis]